AVPRDASTIPSARPAEAAGTGTGPQPGNFGERLTQLRNAGAISNAQCVSLAKAWVGAPASVTTWRKGDAATDGGLQPGTPIATFLNRDGTQSNRYAGGGTGTPGANLDHAGVFHSYITDKDGKRIGMKMLDQWNGANGQPQVRDYFFGDRRGGEKDGRNYFAIKGQDGNYLGGGRNPMSAKGPVAEAAAPRTPEAGSAGVGAERNRLLATPNVDALIGRDRLGAAPQLKPELKDRILADPPDPRPDMRNDFQFSGWKPVEPAQAAAPSPEVKAIITPSPEAKAAVAPPPPPKVTIDGSSFFGWKSAESAKAATVPSPQAREVIAPSPQAREAVNDFRFSGWKPGGPGIAKPPGNWDKSDGGPWINRDTGKAAEADMSGILDRYAGAHEQRMRTFLGMRRDVPPAISPMVPPGIALDP
ncbi:MAG: BPSL0067 family protein, partial [Thermoleophilia bacterium]|nr:BPSL0067 family protein [Thermoleophilia bacterium]